MADGFTRADVHAIAALAQLELDEPELDLFARQLGDILEYATQVQRIDTTGISPTSSVSGQDEVGSGDRPDDVTPSLENQEALANAPDRVVANGGSLFKVPRVIG